MGKSDSHPDANVQQYLEELRANPGDRRLTRDLMEALGQLPAGSSWLQLSKLVSIYQLVHGRGLDKYLDRYRRLGSLKAVLQFDNLYKYKEEEDQREKIYAHQRHLGADILKQASRELSKPPNLEKIEECDSFATLFERVELATRHIHPFGPLAVYDTALRIGAKRRKLPKLVYLHAGAMAGYRHLVKERGVVGPKWVRLDNLPKEVQVLRPHHAENFLCIFKGLFGNSGANRAAGPCC
jgi:hypothetical protein